MDFLLLFSSFFKSVFLKKGQLIKPSFYYLKMYKILKFLDVGAIIYLLMLKANERIISGKYQRESCPLTAGSDMQDVGKKCL